MPEQIVGSSGGSQGPGRSRLCWSEWEMISLKFPKQSIKYSLTSLILQKKETEAQRENLLPESGEKPPNIPPLALP